MAGIWRSQRGAVIFLGLGGEREEHSGHPEAVVIVTRLSGRGHLSTLSPLAGRMGRRTILVRLIWN